MTGEQIAQSALTYVGTPFHYGGRKKGVGVDCVGLAVCALRDLGEEIEDYVGYPLADNYWRMMEAVRRHCSCVSLDLALAEVGDVLVFRRLQGPASRRIENHLGILTETEPLTMVHAYPAGFCKKVTETPLSLYFTDALTGVWRYRGLA